MKRHRLEFLSKILSWDDSKTKMFKVSTSLSFMTAKAKKQTGDLFGRR